MKKLFKKLSGLEDETDVGLNINEENGEETNFINNDADNDYDYDNNEEIEADGESEEYAKGGDKKEMEEQKWLDENYEEGQLSIDVYQTPKKIIVKSTIAGVKPEDIDISINNDMLTIRGKRELSEKIREEDYLFRECYWGGFSRSVILPMEVEAEKIEAVLENGVLTIILPKAKSAQQISIKVKEK